MINFSETFVPVLSLQASHNKIVLSNAWRYNNLIKTRKDIINLLNAYLITKYEIVHQFWMSGAMEWSGKRQPIYLNDIVLGKFRENDESTMQVLKIGVEDKALEHEIRLDIERNIKKYEQLEQLDIMQQMMLKSQRKKQQELQMLSIDEWIAKNCGLVREDSQYITDSEKRVLLYLYYAFSNFNYEREHPYCSDLDELKMVYKSILDKQSQFHKYGIIPIDENRELISIDPPRIYDKIINKTFFTKNVPFLLLQKISEMMFNGIIDDFAVRLLNEPGYEGKMDSEYLAEALERGKLFDFVSLGNYSISKLYSEEYENCMWVIIDPQNITFEELCEDFDIYKEMIVTQVIHLQYDLEDGNAYITHLDHEYIFYSVDEYETRLHDIMQKGKAQARMKSFKIDHAKIPFDSRCKVFRKDEEGNDLPPEDEQFLCYVLECYFKHKDLLNEYFQKI